MAEHPRRAEHPACLGGGGGLLLELELGQLDLGPQKLRQILCGGREQQAERRFRVSKRWVDALSRHGHHQTRRASRRERVRVHLERAPSAGLDDTSGPPRGRDGAPAWWRRRAGPARRRRDRLGVDVADHRPTANPAPAAASRNSPGLDRARALQVTGESLVAPDPDRSAHLRGPRAHPANDSDDRTVGLLGTLRHRRQLPARGHQRVRQLVGAVVGLRRDLLTGLTEEIVRLCQGVILTAPIWVAASLFTSDTASPDLVTNVMSRAGGRLLHLVQASTAPVPTGSGAPRCCSLSSVPPSVARPEPTRPGWGWTPPAPPRGG